ncbi:hypothetical protein H2203_006535 [Taxawa tesnikishii (nom. ined.)]|nr:hypothetical protein H2203_006535 [Dothideales sp. JES 119]
MFKKKPTIKPLAPIRSSDRRKTADNIIADYGLGKPAQDDPSAEDKAASTAERANLRNSLLPENVQSARFTTTHGPDLKQVSGTVFVGSHPGDDQRVLWFKIEDRIYPTVYTLWRNPGMLPLLHTPGFVVQKLQGGADLMTPGLQHGPPFPKKAKKGAIVAIASLENPSVPVAVGVCEIDVSALGSVQGAKGHAVQTMHWAGDEVWSYSTSGKSGMNPPEEIDGWLRDDHDQGLAGQAGELKLEDEDEEGGGVSLGENDANARATEVSPTDEEDEPAQEEDSAKAEVKQMSTKIKKSSFKNIRKFIKSLDKKKIVKSKDRDGNETTILDIDFDDQAIVNFKPYRLPKKETMAGTSLGRGEKATSTIDTGDDSVGQKLQKVEYYKPKERLLPIFASANATAQSLFTAAEIRPLVTGYIESENLISQANKRLVTLNPILANAVFDGSTHLDKEVLAKGSVPRDALIDRIISACSPYYAIIRNKAADDSKPKSGAAPKIKVTLETRSGNKTVTKVSGVEGASVEQLAGSSPKTPVMEIMVQGPQKDAVIKALERRGVNRNWVEFVDKTKKKK